MRIPNFSYLRKWFKMFLGHENMSIFFIHIVFILTIGVFALEYLIHKENQNRSNSLIVMVDISDSFLYEEINQGTSEAYENVTNTATLSHIVASKSGTKYYFTWCVSSRIKEENKIYFESEEEAQKRGLELSKLCLP